LYPSEDIDVPDTRTGRLARWKSLCTRTSSTESQAGHQGKFVIMDGKVREKPQGPNVEDGIRSEV
jgi:hypothetical protein